MMNLLSRSRRTEHLVRIDSPTVTCLNVPIAAARGIASALHANHHVKSLELDFSATSSTDPLVLYSMKTQRNDNDESSMQSLLSLLESTTTLQHIQLFGARSEAAVRYLLPPILRSIQRNPSQPRVDLVCCRILPMNFGLLPTRSALRGVRVWDPEGQPGDDGTAIAASALALAAHASLKQLRLTAYLGLPLLQQLLLHIPRTVEHVAVHHHGCSRMVLDALSQLPPSVTHLQVEYLQCGGSQSGPMATSRVVIPLLRRQLAKNQTENQLQQQPKQRHLTFTSCTFGDDPWPYLEDASVSWEGLCPVVKDPLTVQHLDVSKLVIDRKQRLNEIICMAGKPDSTIASLVLGDVMAEHCVALAEHVLPHTTTLRQLHCNCYYSTSPALLGNTSNKNALMAAALSTALRQAVRKSTSLIEFQLGRTVADDDNRQLLLGAEDAAAIQWYTKERNRRLPAMDRPLPDVKMLPRVMNWSFDAPTRSGPTRVCRHLIESLPY